MTHQFHELLLSELRMVTYQPGNPAQVTDEMLCQAVTLNENIRSLGYVLRPDDMLRLSASSSLNGFFDHLKSLVPDVKAEPMYPGFPQQVMEMPEAQFRLHQLIHYFSTYGVEELLGEPVHRGWLPESDHPERTEKDTALMECRVIELTPEEEAPAAVLRVLMGRRERLTNPELELVTECAPLCSAEQLQGIKVRFKENLDLLFPLMMLHADRETALRTLHALCAHTGDVLDCSLKYLRLCRYHLTTGEKKLLVKLLESYPVNNLRQNLIKSLHQRELNLKVLAHLDYNRFSRSEAHKEAVRALRNGELLSWHGVGEAYLRERSPKALEHFAQRPGYMVRMINRLLSLSYSAEAITEALLPRSGAISGHLAVKTLRTLMKRSAELDGKHKAAVEACKQKYWWEEHSCAPDFSREERRIAEQADSRRREARYICLEQSERQAREDAFRAADDLKRQLKEKERELTLRENALNRMKEAEARRERIYQNASRALDIELLYCRMFKSVPDRLQQQIALLQAEVSGLTGQLESTLVQAQAALDQELIRIRAEGEARYAQMLEEIKAWEQGEREKLIARIEKENAEYAERMRTISQRRDAELAQLEEAYQREKLASRHDAETAQILKKLLRAHFAQVVTPLKDKKVFLDMDAFDLEHSTLESEDRSKDGGYIRSGIAYRIPEDAKHVRFFVYWNDRQRIDIDLHAGGTTMEGESLHVGWNADFRNSGVVHSGDITHSDAAEYIDIDLSAPVREIYANVNLYNGSSFKRVETCYVGMMAVDKFGQEIRHYDPSNCFFTHKLTQHTRNLYYGFIDVQNRFVRFIGQVNESGWAARPSIEDEQSLFSIQEYLSCVMEGQNAELVSDPSEADVVLTMGKSLLECGVSLTDNNFFLEC